MLAKNTTWNFENSRLPNIEALNISEKSQGPQNIFKIEVVPVTVGFKALRDGDDFEGGDGIRLQGCQKLAELRSAGKWGMLLIGNVVRSNY